MTSSNNDYVGVLAADLNGQDLRIGIVQARFNEAIAKRLLMPALRSS